MALHGEHAGARVGSIRAAGSRQGSAASVEADKMIRSILPYSSGISALEDEDNRSKQSLDDMMIPEDDTSVHSAQHFESSHNRDPHTAAEKHAYLHSQHGMDDSVF